MQETSTHTIAIRLGNGVITFFPLTGTSSPTEMEMKSGMSASANLREAIKLHSSLISPHSDAVLLADTPTMMVPEEDFSDESMPLLYDHAFSGHEQELKLSAPLPAFRSVAIFSIPRDIQTVANDNFANVSYFPVCHPVWQYYGRNSQGIGRQHLYCYFHDGKVDLFSTQNQRLKFCNAFSATHPHDAVYYILNAFSQSGFKADRDELVLLGSTPQMQWIEDNLNKYVKRVSLSSEDSGLSVPLDLTLLKQSINQ